jgi:hypothetical protein
MFMILRPEIRTTEYLPEQRGRMYLRIGYALSAR